MRPHAIVLGAVLLVACPTPPVSMFGTSGEETTGASCDGIEILGDCYHQTTAPDIVWPSSAAAADFNDDGSHDVITVCTGTSTQFALCLLQLDGDVTKLDLDWIGSGAALVSAGDFNGDATPDILVSTFNHFAVFTVDDDDLVLHSQFVHDDALDDPADALVYPALPMDIDQDGVAEVVAGGNFNGVRLWRLDPLSGVWGPSGDRHSLPACGDLKSGRVADLDGDGFPELVAIGSHNDCDEGPELPGSGWNQIAIFTGDTMAMGIAPVDTFEAELAAARLDLGDFNGDGELDIVVSDDGENMMVFAGNGDSTFESALALIGLASFSGDGPHAGDFNADGVDEILVEQADESYRLLSGTPMPTALDLPLSISIVLLTQDLDLDSRADIVSLTKSNGQYRLVLTLSDA